MLTPAPTVGTYAAKPAVPSSEAPALGVRAAVGALSVAVDGRGRLVVARFKGLVRGRQFRMTIDVTYEDTTGSEIPTSGPSEVPGASTNEAPGSESSEAPGGESEAGSPAASSESAPASRPPAWPAPALSPPDEEHAGG